MTCKRSPDRHILIGHTSDIPATSKPSEKIHFAVTDGQQVFVAPAQSTEEQIAVKLTENQIRLLLSAEYPNNLRQQTAALNGMYEGDGPISMSGNRAELDFSPDQDLFFATLSRSDKTGFDAKLSALESPQQAKDSTTHTQARTKRDGPERE